MNRRGIALTLVIIIIVSVSMVTAAALTFGYNQRLAARKVVSSRTEAYFFASAGLVDAGEAIRRDAGGNFADPAFNPAPYSLDVDGDRVDDVTVDIGPRDPATGLRRILATGRS